MDQRDFGLARNILRLPMSIAVLDEICDDLADRLGASTVSIAISEAAQAAYRPRMFCSRAQRQAFENPDFVAFFEEVVGSYGPAVDYLFGRPELVYHYAPDDLPEDLAAPIVACAERIERLVGSYHEIAAHFGRSERHRALISMTLPREADVRGFKADPDLYRFSALLAQAFELHAVFDRLQTRYNAVLSFLDRLLLGVAIVDREQRVLLVNERWRELADATGVVQQMNGKLVLRGSVQSLVSDALASHRNGGRTAARGTFQLGDGDDPARHAGFVRPLRVTREEFGEEHDAAAIILLDTKDSRLASLEVTAALLSLTPAETDTLRHLLEGLTYREISDARNVSTETTKHHVSGILSKAGCQRVHQLMVKVARLDTPVK